MHIEFAGACVERCSWTSGEVLTGEVVISASKPILTRSITVLLSGREKAEVSTTEFEVEVGAFSGDITPKVKTKTFRERAVLLRRFVTLVGAPLGQAQGAPTKQLDGTHRLPFSFQLPATLPGIVSVGSGFFGNYVGDVAYTLEARVDSMGLLPFTDATKSMSVPVRGNPVNAAAVEKLMVPLPRNAPYKVENSKAFTLSKGRLTATCSLPTRAVVTGDKISLHLDVRNDTAVALAAIRVQLRSSVTVKALGKTKKDSGGPCVLLAALSPVTGPAACRSAVADAQKSGSCDLQLLIPVTAITTHNSELLSTTHTLYVELVPQGWLHLPLVVQLAVGVYAPPAATAAKAAALQKATPANAIEHGSASEDDVRSALAHSGGSVTSTGPKGHTALHLACLRGQASLARLLIAAGCSVEAVTELGFTPLHSAAFGGDWETCIAVLEGAAACVEGNTDDDGLARLQRVREAKTKRGSTAEALAKMDITGDHPSPADLELAAAIAAWAPEAQKAAGTGTGTAADDDDHDHGDAGALSDDEEQEAVAPEAGAGSREPEKEARVQQGTAPRMIDWMPDDDSLVCLSCNTEFGIFLRRHHCRSCGILVCYECSPKRASRLLPGIERTCPKCCVDAVPLLSVPPTATPAKTPAPTPAPTPSPAPAPAPAPAVQQSSVSSESDSNARGPMVAVSSLHTPSRAPQGTAGPETTPSTPAPAPAAASAVTTPQLRCVFEHGAHIRDTPSKNAKLIGEIDYGETAAGTGKTHVEPHGLMYVELCRSPQHPQGGWVPVHTRGHSVMQELHTDAGDDDIAISEMPSPSPAKQAKSGLRYRCCFRHGAYLRDAPSYNAANIGEIDEGHVVVATGKVHTEPAKHGQGKGHGEDHAEQTHDMPFIQVQVSEEHPLGGWVPLVSRHGHTVMEPYIE